MIKNFDIKKKWKKNNMMFFYISESALRKSPEVQVAHAQAATSDVNGSKKLAR